MRNRRPTRLKLVVSCAHRRKARQVGAMPGACTTLAVTKTASPPSLHAAAFHSKRERETCSQNRTRYFPSNKKTQNSSAAAAAAAADDDARNQNTRLIRWTHSSPLMAYLMSQPFPKRHKRQRGTDKNKTRNHNQHHKRHKKTNIAARKTAFKGTLTKKRWRNRNLRQRRANPSRGGQSLD